MMNEKKKQRALNVFSAMGSLPDEYVNAAESALYEAEAGLYRPARPQGPVRRFLNSGWGVALISGIAALAAVTLILRAGQDPGVVTPPVGSDPATDTETEADGTDSAAPESASDSAPGMTRDLESDFAQYNSGDDAEDLPLTIHVVEDPALCGQVRSWLAGQNIPQLYPDGPREAYDLTAEQVQSINRDIPLLALPEEFLQLELKSAE